MNWLKWKPVCNFQLSVSMNSFSHLLLAPEVATQLYPHQKKALTFLMEREREVKTAEGVYSSMWLMRKTMSGHGVWTHLVTEKEVYEEPQESKGAILADDVRYSLFY